MAAVSVESHYEAPVDTTARKILRPKIGLDDDNDDANCGQEAKFMLVALTRRCGKWQRMGQEATGLAPFMSTDRWVGSRLFLLPTASVISSRKISRTIFEGVVRG